MDTIIIQIYLPNVLWVAFSIPSGSLLLVNHLVYDFLKKIAMSKNNLNVQIGQVNCYLTIKDFPNWTKYIKFLTVSCSRTMKMKFGNMQK
jgi:hypothetical protein